MNQYRYPRYEELKRIETWGEDFNSLMDFIKSIWWMPGWGWEQTETTAEFFDYKVIKYFISTGGWSGNEEIIEAMKKNFIFWTMCWVSSRRGGHYEFELKT